MMVLHFFHASSCNEFLGCRKLVVVGVNCIQIAGQTRDNAEQQICCKRKNRFTFRYQKGILHVLHAQLYRLFNRKYKCGIMKNKTNSSFPFLGVALEIPWHLRYFLILICFLGGVFAELQSVARPWWSQINVILKM